MMTVDDDSKLRKEGGPESRVVGDGVTHFPGAGRKKACPICGKPVKLEFRPFCSKRCADIDLGRWLGEAYRIPAEEPPDGRDAEGGAPPEQGADPGRR
jgi:endogenous inhibitor of DNA gyrase (YacG/DUF329 family)